MENGKYCQTQNNFKAAISVVLLYLKQSEETIVTSDIDYETEEAMDHFKRNFKFKYHKVDTWKYEEVENMVNKNDKIKMVWL